MTLLIVILLTATGMQEQQVWRMKDDETCIKALPVMREVAEEMATHGFIAACVKVENKSTV